MRPYKYPYLSIFILGYYFLEHQGYYYRLRSWMGYPEVDQINYLIKLTLDSFAKFSSVPNRKMFLYLHDTEDPALRNEFNKTARKAKEKKRSPVMFCEVDCSENRSLCCKIGIDKYPSFVVMNQDKVVGTYSGPFSKRKLLKFLGDSTEN